MAGQKARSGRHRKPSAVHELQGTARADRHGGGLRLSQAHPVPPSWMTGAEQEIWNEVLPCLQAIPGLLTAIDGVALWSLCEAIAELIAAREEIEQDGATAESEKGSVYQHPAVGRKNKALERLRGWLARFGMDPSSRASLHVTAREAVNPFEEFLQRRLDGDQ